MRIAVLIVSAYRPGKDYLRRTVQSLKDSGYWNRDQTLPLQIVVCGLSAEFLDPWKLRGIPWIQVTTMRQGQADVMNFIKLGPQQRCCLGHYLAMQHALGDPALQQADYYLICEDDVVFAGNWHAHLRAIIPEINKEYGDRWILSLYRCNESDMLEKFRQGVRWYRQDESVLLGTQAMLYSKEMIRRVMPIMVNEGAYKNEVHADQAVARASAIHGIPLVLTIPCLCQHQGDLSLHQSGMFHQAEVFHSNVPTDVPLPCPKCGVMPGSRHREDCEVERCSECGFDRVLCKAKHFDHDPSFARWTGFMPGVLEARALGMKIPEDLRFDDLYKLFYIKPKP